ncbi:ankyrin repeat domain-containing protein [Pedobacter sp. MC2016-24]|uniref:ankyrin repeat domain-containing protein n=1 Tax=Pedobacter sp. MC2016-24 TaxID=2780090 RepID=UPI00187E9040|nr:ankyrin repeat domain-containing protein [Pedobacter sp. MC2016-24]MBE9598469.1 ankyrin repeat domain-containing protein [Pedobacter sp. MC2016-24]
MKYGYLLFLLLIISCSGPAKNPEPSPEIINQFYDAVFADRTAEALKLIKTGQFPADAEPKNKILPMQAAIWQNNLLLVQTLAEGGANLNPKTLSLVNVAAEKGFLDIVRYLHEKGAEINKAPAGSFSAAAASKNYACAKYLLLKGADPRLGELSNKLNYFLTAVKQHDYQVIDLLQLSKSDVDYNDCSGETALIIAIKANDAKMVEYLIHKGADKSKPETFDCGDTESFGLKPIQLAKKMNNKTIIDLLK